jgi:outer membrane protein
MRSAFLAAALATTTLSGIAATAVAGVDKPWLVHVRGIAVIPDESATVSIGGDVEIGEAFVPEVDVSYFFAEDWSVELIAATSPHEVKHTAPLDLGTAWVLPPTLTVKYHIPTDGPIRPYIGAGINYTTFWNLDEPANLDLDYSDSWGLALQAGIEIELNDRWTFNIDVKKIDIDTDVTIRNATTGATIATAEVEIDPLVVGIGFGYRF